MPRSRAAAITGASWGTPGLLTTVLDLAEQIRSVHLQVNFDARLGEPFRAFRGRLNRQPITARHGRAGRLRRRRPRARQADDQERALRQGAGRAFMASITSRLTPPCLPPRRRLGCLASARSPAGTA